MSVSACARVWEGRKGGLVLFRHFNILERKAAHSSQLRILLIVEKQFHIVSKLIGFYCK